MCVFMHLMCFILSYIYNIYNIIYYLIVHFVGIFMTFYCDIIYFFIYEQFYFYHFWTSQYIGIAEVLLTSVNKYKNY